MKSYSVSGARQHLAEVLDRAEEGEDIVIERRGVRFAVTPMVAKARVRRRAPRVELLDPLLEAGSWSWSWSQSTGAELAESPSPRRRKASRG